MKLTLENKKQIELEIRKQAIKNFIEKKVSENE